MEVTEGELMCETSLDVLWIEEIKLDREDDPAFAVGLSPAAAAAANNCAVSKVSPKVGIEFFFGLPFGLVGATKHPPCITWFESTIKVKQLKWIFCLYVLFLFVKVRASVMKCFNEFEY